MPIYKIGSIIYNKRIELEVSQEELADGICSVSTLSRIENGERMPTKNHFEALMERLGASSIMLDCYIDENTLDIQELKYRIQQGFLDRELAGARECLQQLESLVRDKKSTDWQFVLYHRVLLSPEKLTTEERLEKLEEALMLTCRRYKEKGLPRVMSYREINILNTIANTYGMDGQYGKAIAILQHIRDFYDRHITIPEEALRTQPMVLCNLSKYLGQSGKYDACIEVCDQGIRIARQTGRSQKLAKTLYNRAWALLRRNRETDREQAELALRQACYHAYAMEQKREFPAIKKYYEAEFGPLKL